MVRFQVSLAEAQWSSLRRMSSASGSSMSSLVRDAVDMQLAAQRKRTLSAIGKFSSGACDVSLRHDRYLADAFYDDLRSRRRPDGN
jgi:hypothetical protein